MSCQLRFALYFVFQDNICHIEPLPLNLLGLSVLLLSKWAVLLGEVGQWEGLNAELCSFYTVIGYFQTHVLGFSDQEERESCHLHSAPCWPVVESHLPPVARCSMVVK